MQLVLSYASEVWNESAKFEEVGNLKSFILFVWLVTINTSIFGEVYSLHLPLHSTGAIS